MIDIKTKALNLSFQILAFCSRCHGEKKRCEDDGYGLLQGEPEESSPGKDHEGPPRLYLRNLMSSAVSREIIGTTLFNLGVLVDLRKIQVVRNGRTQDQQLCTAFVTMDSLEQAQTWVWCLHGRVFAEWGGRPIYADVAVPRMKWMKPSHVPLTHQSTSSSSASRRQQPERDLSVPPWQRRVKMRNDQPG